MFHLNIHTIDNLTYFSFEFLIPQFLRPRMAPAYDATQPPKQHLIPCFRQVLLLHTLHESKSCQNVSFSLLSYSYFPKLRQYLPQNEHIFFIPFR